MKHLSNLLTTLCLEVITEQRQCGIRSIMQLPQCGSNQLEQFPDEDNGRTGAGCLLECPLYPNTLRIGWYPDSSKSKKELNSGSQDFYSQQRGLPTNKI